MNSIYEVCVVFGEGVTTPATTAGVNNSSNNCGHPQVLPPQGGGGNNSSNNCEDTIGDDYHLCTLTHSLTHSLTRPGVRKAPSARRRRRQDI